MRDPWARLDGSVSRRLAFDRLDYSPQEGPGFMLAVDWGVDTRDVDLGEAVPITAGDTMAWALSEFFPPGIAPRQGDTLIRRRDGRRYRVADVRPDGDNAVILVLRDA